MLSGNSESVFEFYYLGMIQNVNLGIHLSQKSDVLLIDKIEEAQVDFLNTCYIAYTLLSVVVALPLPYYSRYLLNSQLRSRALSGDIGPEVNAMHTSFFAIETAIQHKK